MSGFWKAVGSAGKKILKGGKQKTSGTEVVNPFKFKASKNKLEQNEELANLRADTSLEKQEMANEAREKLAMMKPRPNGRN